jgi:hypothetical protein
MSENNNPEILLNGDFSQLVEISGGNYVPTLWVGDDGTDLHPSHWDQTKLNSNIMQRSASDGMLLIRDRFSPNAGDPLEKETQYSITITPTATNANKRLRIRFRRKGNTKNCPVTWNTIDGNDVNISNAQPQYIASSATFTTSSENWLIVDTIEIGFASKWHKLDTISLKKVAVEPQETIPVITSNGGENNATVEVYENTTAVTTVQADGGGITYSIITGDDSEHFTIDPSTGVLAFQSPPDYENPADEDGGTGANNTYMVTVMATNSQGSDSQFFMIHVRDVPSITINDTTDITEGGATLSGAITDAGDETPTTIKLLWGVDPFYEDYQTENCCWDWSENVSVDSLPTFEIVLGSESGIWRKATKYYFKFTVTNSSGSSFHSDVKSFTTAGEITDPLYMWGEKFYVCDRQDPENAVPKPFYGEYEPFKVIHRNDYMHTAGQERHDDPHWYDSVVYKHTKPGSNWKLYYSHIFGDHWGFKEISDAGLPCTGALNGQTGWNWENANDTDTYCDPSDSSMKLTYYGDTPVDNQLFARLNGPYGIGSTGIDWTPSSGTIGSMTPAGDIAVIREATYCNPTPTPTPTPYVNPCQVQEICVSGVAVQYYYQSPQDVNGVYTLQSGTTYDKPKWSTSNGSHSIQWAQYTDYTGWEIYWIGQEPIKVTGYSEDNSMCPYGDGISTSKGGTITLGDCEDAPPSTPAPGPCSHMIDDSVFECAMVGSGHQISVAGSVLQELVGGGGHLEIRGGEVHPGGTYSNEVNGKPWWGQTNNVHSGLSLSWDISECKWHLSDGGSVSIHGSPTMFSGTCPWNWNWPEGVDVTEISASTTPVPHTTVPVTPVHEGCDVTTIYVCEHPAGFEWVGTYTKTSSTINGEPVYTNDGDHFIAYGESVWGFTKGTSTNPNFPHDGGRADNSGRDCPTEQTWVNYVPNANGQMAVNHALKVSASQAECPVPFINIVSIVVDANQLVTVTVDFGGSDVDHWHYKVDGFIDETMVMSGNSAIIPIVNGVGMQFTLNVYATNSTAGENHPWLAQASQTFDIAEETPTPTPKVVYEPCGEVPCVVTSPLETNEAGKYKVFGQGAGSREAWFNNKGGDNRRIIYWKTDPIGDKWVMGKSPTNVLYEMDSSYDESGRTYCPWDIQNWVSQGGDTTITEINICPDEPVTTTECGEILLNGDFSELHSGSADFMVPTIWTREGSPINPDHVDQGKNQGLKRTTFCRTDNDGYFKLRQTFTALGNDEQFTLTIDNAFNKSVRVKFLRKGATKGCKVTWNSIDGTPVDSSTQGSQLMKRTATFTTSSESWTKPDTIEIWIGNKSIRLDSVSLQPVVCNLLTNGDFSDQDGGTNTKYPKHWTNGGDAIVPGHVDQGYTGLKRTTFRRTSNTGDFKLRQAFDELGKGEQFTLTIDNPKNKTVKVKFLRKNATKNCKVTWNSIDGVVGDSSTANPKTIKRTATFTTLEDWNKPDTIEIWIGSKWVHLDAVSLYRG